MMRPAHPPYFVLFFVDFNAARPVAYITLTIARISASFSNAGFCFFNRLPNPRHNEYLPFQI